MIQNVTKNLVCTISISDLGHKGEGIGKLGAFILYVSGAVPGDEVEVKILKVKKRYGYAKLLRVIHPSPDRIEAPCPVALRCGGCQIQHIRYDAQLNVKARSVKEAVHRIGGISTAEFLPIVGMETPFYYRNKAQFAVGTSQKHDGCDIGFYAIHSHHIVDTTTCMIQHPSVTKVLGIVRHFIDSHGLSLYDETSHKGLVRHLVIRSSFSTGKMMVCLVINGKTLPEAKKFIAACTSHEDVSSVYLCHNREPGDVVMRGTLTHLTGAPALYETLGDLRFRISPFSFFQVNPVQTVKLYDYVLESCHLTGYEVVMDLYCGTGSIALYLARHAKKVIGIESVKEAIEDARENASLNGISNVEFRCQDVLVYVHGEKQPEKPDVVILDPPRKGCECGVLESVGDLAPQRLVYISCNPATFARDAAILVSLGYTLESVKPFDLFAQTMHVESVGIFIHQSN